VELLCCCRVSKKKAQYETTPRCRESELAHRVFSLSFCLPPTSSGLGGETTSVVSFVMQVKEKGFHLMVKSSVIVLLHFVPLFSLLFLLLDPSSNCLHQTDIKCKSGAILVPKEPSGNFIHFHASSFNNHKFFHYLSAKSHSTHF